MKKSTGKQLFGVILSWIVLIGFIAGTVYYTSNIEFSIDSPVITQVKADGDSVTIEWKSVPYATSYRVFRRIPGEDWVLLKAVGSSVLSYTDDKADNPQYQYSLKSCCSYKDDAIISKFSAARDIGYSHNKEAVN